MWACEVIPPTLLSPFHFPHPPSPPHLLCPHCRMGSCWHRTRSDTSCNIYLSTITSLPLLLLHSTGHLKLFDVDTNSQVFSLSGLDTLSSVSLDSRHHVTALAAAHHHYADAHSEITVMVVGGGEGEGERRRLPIESKVAAV